MIDVDLNWKTIAAGGAVAVGLYLFAKQEVTDTAKKVGQAVNPTSRDNIFNRGFEAVGGAVAGEDDWSLGSKIYEWLNPDKRTAEQIMNNADRPSEARTYPAPTRAPILRRRIHSPEQGIRASREAMYLRGTSGGY